MQQKLEEALKALLQEFPELADTNIRFTENKEVIAESAIPICEMKEEQEIIAGASPKIEIRKSGVHGYGVFAKELIKAGELIEENRLLELELRSKQLTDEVLKNYVWRGPDCGCLLCKTYGSKQYLAFGLPSLCNHSDKTNTKQQINYEKRISQIWAAVDIKPTEEIYVTYGNKYWLIRDFWAHVNKNEGIAKFHKANIAKNITE